MNRRNFIRNLVVAGASFTILPGAGRLWKARIIHHPCSLATHLLPFQEALHEYLDLCSLTRASAHQFTADEFRELFAEEEKRAASLVRDWNWKGELRNEQA